MLPSFKINACMILYLYIYILYIRYATRGMHMQSLISFIYNLLFADIFPYNEQDRIIIVPKASLIYCEATSSIHGIKALSVCSKRTTVAHVGHKTKFSLSFTFHWLFKYKVGTECSTPVVCVHVHAVIVLKLMLAGDVETNPGPPGMYNDIYE